MASDTLRLSAIVDIGGRCGPRGAAWRRPDLVGRRLGPYLLAERIGDGAYAVVYRARHELMELDRDVKVLHSLPGPQCRHENWIVWRESPLLHAINQAREPPQT